MVNRLSGEYKSGLGLYNIFILRKIPVPYSTCGDGGTYSSFIQHSGRFIFLKNQKIFPFLTTADFISLYLYVGIFDEVIFILWIEGHFHRKF